MDLLIRQGNEEDKRLLYHCLKEQKRDYLVRIEKKRPLRSSQQNKYYFGVVIAYIAGYTGHNALFIHEYLKSEFGHLIEFEDFMFSTSRIDTVKFNEYIRIIREWAKDKLELEIPDPDGCIL